jgi:hypothetical protein
MQGIGLAQVTFPLGTLFGQDVAAMRVVAFEATGTGTLEPFGGPAIGFHFGHYQLRLFVMDGNGFCCQGIRLFSCGVPVSC